MPNINELFPALVDCFAIILFGYVSGRLNIITPKQAQGLGLFVGTFALPALLLANMVELDFHTVSWGFLIAVLVSKSLVFVIVLLFSLILIKSCAIGRGALYAIFATQSNDFAIGYSLAQAIYGNSHPEFLQYIYLIAPISFLILNPIGFMLLEINKYRNPDINYTLLEDGNSNIESNGVAKSTEVTINDKDSIETNYKNEEDSDAPQNHFQARTCIKNVSKGVLLNPLVTMVFIGLAGHFIFKGHLPSIVKVTLTTLGNAYAGAALFYLGLSMVGKISQQKGSDLIVPFALIVAKIVVLPILIREFMLIFGYTFPIYNPDGLPQNSTNMTDYLYNLADYGYLYGTFPTAPTIVIFAARYGIETDRLAAGMVFCTSLSAPIMYVSAWTLSMSRMSSEYLRNELHVVDKDISIITLFCATWCIVIFFIGRKFNRVPHVVTLAYLFALIFSSLGTIMWQSFSRKSSTPTLQFLFGMLIFGVTSSRLLTASIAVALVMVLSKGQRWMWKNSVWFILAPFMLSVLTTAVLMAACDMDSTAPRAVFAYGHGQEITSFIVVTISFIITITCLIMILKKHGYHDVKTNDKKDDAASPLLSNQNTDISCPDEDSDNAYEEENWCLFTVKCKRGDVQKVRHIVLLLLLSLSMFIGIFLIIWRLTEDTESGLYFEIAFLDSVFGFGQGFFVFCVFGLDSDLIIDPIVRFYRKIRYNSEDISLPDLNTVDKKALNQCLQFITHHLEDCKVEIVGEKRSLLKLYYNVFTGTDFCTWLVDRGLVNDRAEAILYGENLFLGRVIYHCTNKHYFHDHDYLYKFEEPKTCYKKIMSPSKTIDLKNSGSIASSSHSTTKQSTSKQLCPKIPGSPSLRSYHGYSFEAHLKSIDRQNFSTFLPSRLDNANKSLNNNLNPNYASTSGKSSKNWHETPNFQKYETMKAETHDNWSDSDSL